MPPTFDAKARCPGLVLSSPGDDDFADASHARLLHAAGSADDAAGKLLASLGEAAPPPLASPPTALSFAALAVFLTDVRQEHDKAERYFQMAADLWEDHHDSGNAANAASTPTSTSAPASSASMAACFYLGAYAVRLLHPPHTPVLLHTPACGAVVPALPGSASSQTSAWQRRPFDWVTSHPGTPPFSGLPLSASPQGPLPSLGCLSMLGPRNPPPASIPFSLQARVHTVLCSHHSAPLRTTPLRTAPHRTAPAPRAGLPRPHAPPLRRRRGHAPPRARSPPRRRAGPG